MNNPNALPAAKDCDPLALGWMQGSPPAADKIIRFEDGSGYRFPQLRWSFAHYRQLVPTVTVAKGLKHTTPLPMAQGALPKVSYTPMGGTGVCNWAEMMEATYTDAILVLHKGQVLLEHFGGVMTPGREHIAMSVSKSFMGLLAACLVAEGVLDETQRVDHYVPELAGSGFGDATVRQVMDMTTAIDYTENYADPQAEIWMHARAGGVLPRPPQYAGPQTFYEFLQTVQKEGQHGGNFAYKTVNTDVIGWVIRRVTGLSIGEVLSQRIWSKLGMEQDAYFTVDSAGNEFAGGGLSAGLRDMARFGELLRNHGAWAGQQIIPQAVIHDIRFNGDASAFPVENFPTLGGWAYRNMWWVSNNAHGAYSARGIHGQAIYIDPKAEMVIARFGSHPLAANTNFDPTSLPAYHAVAQFLLKQG